MSRARPAGIVAQRTARSNDGPLTLILSLSLTLTPHPNSNPHPNQVRVPTMPPGEIIERTWDVIIADCEGCFSVLLQEILSAKQLLNATRAVVLESDHQPSPYP